MCQFKSGIITKDNCYYSLDFESHEEIIKQYKLKDEPNYMVRVELIPSNQEDIWDKDESKWQLKVDQGLIPQWFDDDMKVTARERMMSALRETWKERFVFEGEERKEIKEGSNWMVKGNVNSICGSANVNFIRDSAKVDSICGSAYVNSIRGSAKVDSIRDSAKVDSIRDSAHVNFIYNIKQIGEQKDDSIIITKDKEIYVINKDYKLVVR